MRPKLKNEYIILGTVAVVDVSTPTYPDSSMKIDLDQWVKLLESGIGRVGNDCGYAIVRVNGKNAKIHKLLTPHFKHQVDHFNQDKLDNRLSNLLDLPQCDNTRNQPLSKRNTSGATGVRFRDGVKGETWAAFINTNGGQITLGTFNSKEKAIKARAAANIKYGFSLNHGKSK